MKVLIYQFFDWQNSTIASHVEWMAHGWTRGEKGIVWLVNFSGANEEVNSALASDCDAH